MVWRGCTQGSIDVGEVFAVEFVEISVVGGMVLGAVPPIPITALGDEKLFISELPLCFRGMGCIFGIKFPGAIEIVPGEIVLGGADPNIEVRVNPGARNQCLERIEVLLTRYGLGYGDSFYARLILQAIIEAAQKFAARLGEVLPCVFAVEND